MFVTLLLTCIFVPTALISPEFRKSSLATNTFWVCCKQRCHLAISVGVDGSEDVLCAPLTLSCSVDVDNGEDVLCAPPSAAMPS